MDSHTAAEVFSRLDLTGPVAYVKGKAVRVDEVVQAMHAGPVAINALRELHGTDLQTMIQCLRYRVWAGESAQLGGCPTPRAR